MNAKPGDRVKIITKDEIREGILMPNQETGSVIIKLDNGYNIGIDSKKINEIKVVEKYRAKETPSKKELKKDPKKPTIAILHTGGTIASKVDYRTGGVVARFSPEEILEMFPELNDIANIRSKLISNMFSEDMRFKHYALMCKAIEEEVKKGVDGIILTHGTDTLGYSAAALSFALENINIPVLLVGSQRSSDRGSSDAAVNLICAASFIAGSDFVGVGICMHNSTGDNNCLIMPACKTRKMHTSRRDAFKVVNDKAIARVNYETGDIDFINKNYNKKNEKNKLKILDKFEEKTGLLKCHPNMFPEQFEFFKNYKGLVIEGTGLGQAPVGTPNEIAKIHKKNLEAIKKIVKNGCIVVMASQCIFGSVQMHVYSDAIDLANAGVISGQDMLAETAFIKLAWLLGNYRKEEAKKMISENLRGEINERLLEDEFLQ
ncbi:Glu-tRNA(Gln) amidotransferase subunit GatD [Candidatus Woesearchaeota archaeon]|nr:Glu-tRNA(Gln) amidotransferase subunit GatD [Candidatus Woesearchaeota archaeon]